MEAFRPSLSLQTIFKMKTDKMVAKELKAIMSKTIKKILMM